MPLTAGRLANANTNIEEDNQEGEGGKVVKHIPPLRNTLAPGNGQQTVGLLDDGRGVLRGEDIQSIHVDPGVAQCDLPHSDVDVHRAPDQQLTSKQGLGVLRRHEQPGPILQAIPAQQPAHDLHRQQMAVAAGAPGDDPRDLWGRQRTEGNKGRICDSPLENPILNRSSYQGHLQAQ